MTKILAIEDETILREEIVEWLSLEGYETVGAEDGMAGIEAAYRELPDLIVCDITMPRRDGYEVFLELHSNAVTANTPFIFLTARAAHEDIRRGMALGADDYITKPFTRMELLAAIEARVQKKAVQEQIVRHQVAQLEQALAQEHEEALLRSKLVAMFSHDFRNQLTVIISCVSLVRDYADKLSEELRLERLNKIESSARVLIQMLEDMLTVAQMETGSVEIKSESVNPTEFIREVVEEFQSSSGERHRLSVDSNVNTNLLIDAKLLRQVVSNLVSNAIKYSSAGTDVKITLDHEGRQWAFSVRDHGIGIPEKDQERLFNAFKRGSNVGKIAGTGLGLAIVKRAVDLMNGSIQVESKVGAGTRITVFLPMERAQ